MDLFIPDLYEVLKSRVKRLTHPKASQDPANVLTGIVDLENVIKEIKAKAEAQALEIERLNAEQETK